MPIAVRRASHPDAACSYDTARLRAEFLVETLFRPDAVKLTYSHVDRIVVGGAMPATSSLRLETDKATIGQATFLARRELGICNVGGPGSVVCDGETYQVNLRDMLYVAMGTVEVSFHSDDIKNPAKFYLFSTPAHARHVTSRCWCAGPTPMPSNSARRSRRIPEPCASTSSPAVYSPASSSWG